MLTKTKWLVFSANALLLAIMLCALLCRPTEAQAQIRHHPRHRVILERIIQHANTVVFTPQTVFAVDGNTCDYEQVPQNAVITAIEFSPDGRTVTKVHFRKPARTRGPE